MKDIKQLVKAAVSKSILKLHKRTARIAIDTETMVQEDDDDDDEIDGPIRDGRLTAGHPRRPVVTVPLCKAIFHGDATTPRGDWPDRCVDQ